MENITHMLTDAFAEVLEQFAFMFADLDEEVIDDEASRRHFHSTLAFDGPHTGTLELVASESLSIQLAANVLGVEEDQIDEPSAEDALKELLNVTCGKFLDELAGPQVIFNLSIPDIRIIDHAQYEALISEPGMVEMQVEYQPIYLRAKVT